MTLKDYMSLKDLPTPAEVSRRNRSQKGKLVIKIIIFVLLGILALSLLVQLLIHPIDWLKLRMNLTQSYEIVIENPYTSTKHIRVDGKYVSVGYGNNPPHLYYEVTRDGIYVYEQRLDNGWTKTKSDQSSIIIGGDSGLRLEELLNSRKFRWAGIADGTLFSYSLKKNAQIDGIRIVKFYVKNGDYTFSFFPETGYKAIRIVITNIGKTEVGLPRGT